MCRRAEFYYQQFYALAALRQQAGLEEGSAFRHRTSKTTSSLSWKLQ
jgi:hypothetical protein